MSELNIVQISKKVSLSGFNVNPGWPSFAAWMKSQVPVRDITGYLDSGEIRGWSDDFSSEGRTPKNGKRLFKEAVLESELVGLLMSPPLELEKDTAKKYVGHLEAMGLLAGKSTRIERSSYWERGHIYKFRI